MIGDDEIDPKPLRSLRRGKGADAHVDADNEADARGGGALDYIGAQIVALADAVRNVKVSGASAEFNCSFQNNDCHRSIDVIVAVDEHRLFAFDGGLQSVDRGAHASHLLG